jgi:hypothetical protein
MVYHRFEVCNGINFKACGRSKILEIVPLSLKQAQGFVAQHHRHNKPPIGHKFSLGVMVDGALVGVAVAGRPVARALDDGRTLEVTRTCTDGTPNANSKLYGAVTRAAKAMGYKRLVTYTQADETGASLRASGWKAQAALAPRAGWSCASRPRNDIGSSNIARVRWEIYFA